MKGEQLVIGGQHNIYTRRATHSRTHEPVRYVKGSTQSPINYARVLVTHSEAYIIRHQYVKGIGRSWESGGAALQDAEGMGTCTCCSVEE